MSDLDRLLRDSLKRAGDRYDPAASAASRERFVAFRKRRAMTRGFASVAIVAVVIGAAAVAAPWPKSDDVEGPAGPSGQPSALAGEMYVTQTIQVGAEPTDVEISDAHLYVGHKGVGPIDVVDPARHKVTDSLAGFSNAEEAHIPSFQFVEVEAGTAWTAGDGGLTSHDFGETQILCSANPEGKDVPVEFDCTPSAFPHLSREGSVADMELTADALWLSGLDHSTGSDRYEIAAYARDLNANDGVEPLQRLDFSGTPRLEHGYGALWVTEQQFGDPEGVYRVDPETLAKETVKPADPTSPSGSPFLSASDVSVGAGGVWAFGSPGASLGYMVTRIDPETSRSGEHIVLPGVPNSTFGWVEASDDLGVFVMAKISAGHSKLFRVNPATEEVIGEPLDFGPGPFALESGFRSLWIADQSESVVHRVEIGVREEADLTFRIDEKSSGFVRATEENVRTARSDYSILRRAIKRAARSNEKRAARAAELAALQAELDEIIARIGRRKEKADSRSALNRIEKLLDKAMRGLD